MEITKKDLFCGATLAFAVLLLMVSILATDAWADPWGYYPCSVVGTYCNGYGCYGWGYIGSNCELTCLTWDGIPDEEGDCHDPW